MNLAFHRGIKLLQWLKLPTLALALCSLSTPAAADWVEINSPSFQVVSNAGNKRAQRVAREFEEVRRAITLWFPGLEHDPARIRIYALATTDQMAEFSGLRQRNVAGFFRHSDLGGEIVLGMDVDTQQSFGILNHEYFHSVTRHSLPGLPLWLNEGLAEIWSNSLIGEKKIQLGIVNRNYMRFLGQTKLIPLEKMLDPDTAARSYSDRDTRPSFYAQSWALTHYFMMGDNSARWPLLLQYLELCAQGQPEKEVWEQVFGTRKEVTKDLWKYLNGRRFSSRILDASAREEGQEYPSRALNEAEVQTFRAASHLRGGDRDLARKLLDESAQSDTSAFAFETRGYLALQQGDLDLARQNFEQALTQDKTRHLAHFHLATVEQRQGSDGWVERAERYLLDAVFHAKWFGPAHSQLARIYASIDSSPARAVVVAERALNQSRGDAMAHLQYAYLSRAAEKDPAEVTRSLEFAKHLATVSSGAQVPNNVCWWGTLYGLAEEVYPICETAVRRRPESSTFRDSRGLARTVLGDLKGAAEDFAALVDDPDTEEQVRSLRRSWLEALRAGQNPIDEGVLEELKTSAGSSANN